MHLSKSKYCLLWQCPKLLWLETNRPELKSKNAALEDRGNFEDMVKIIGSKH